MASSPRPDGPPSTTTVSSVLVQAGDCRITIAILKCGTWVQLQLSESVPNLLEIGSNQEETNKLLQDHELLLAKLKPLEGQVWDLLREADKTAAENTDQGLVYDAMAETLGDAWDSLICFLEKRRGLLKLTSSFFEKALEFAVKIDQVEDFLRNSQEFETPESLKLLLCQHKLHTKELLQKSLVLLNKSQDLTEFIEEFKSDGPNINPEFFQGAHSSCLKIDRLLEALQDRRRQLDKYLKLQRQGLEQVLHICQWHHRENQVTSWYKKNIKDYFHKHNFGSTLKENEELLQEHKEIENKVKVIDFIGACLDSTLMRAFLPQSRQDNLCSSIHRIHMDRAVPALSVQKLLSHMASTVSTVPHTRLRMRPLQLWFNRMFQPQRDSPSPLPSNLHPLVSIVVDYVHRRLILSASPHLDFVYRCLLYRVGSPMCQSLDTGHLGPPGDHQETTRHINYLELLVVFKALRSFEDTLW
ncbi:hypothetical protein EYD10_08773 [Varanus komodoensis]|nr:hypothetical protein EYD10_08773 [Varanus komodoensis]